MRKSTQSFLGEKEKKNKKKNHVVNSINFSLHPLSFV